MVKQIRLAQIKLIKAYIIKHDGHIVLLEERPRSSNVRIYKTKTAAEKNLARDLDAAIKELDLMVNGKLLDLYTPKRKAETIKEQKELIQFLEDCTVEEVK